MWAQAGEEGLVLCGRQYMNSLAESSLEEIKAAIRETPWLASHFDIGEKYIRTACGRIAYAFSGLDRNIDSIKGKSRLKLAWIDEAEPVTDVAWTKLIPTLREDDSELWVTWNPESKRSATHKRFREAADDTMKVVEMNWRDNPWFPAILDRKRLADKRDRPEQYEHIWEGDFKAVYEGAYYSTLLQEARREGRIGNVAADPLMTIRLVCDIGGTGAKADAFTIWAMQFVGREIRLLSYYEAQGQAIGAHLEWMRSNGYTPGKASIWLPHDGDNNDRVFDVSYRSAFEAAGYAVEVVPNQGKGAAMMRVEAGRRLLPRCWFNEATTKGGIEALAAYHEKRDDKREIGLGPNHDWSSHGADAFGLGCVIYEEPQVKRQAERQRPAVGGWMGR